MRKIFSIILIIFIILSSVFSVVLSADNEIIVLIDFEEGNENWLPWTREGSELTSYTTEGYSQGKRGILVNDNNAGLSTGAKSDLFPIKAGETYTALGDIYLISGSINFYLRYYDKDKVQILSKYVSAPLGKWANTLITREAPDNAVYANVMVATGGATKCVAIVDNLRLVAGKVAAVTPNGKIPSELPIEEELKLEPVEDGIPEGTVVYHTSFEDGIDKEWVYQGREEDVECVTVVTDNVSEGEKAIRIVDSTNQGAPGIKSGYISVSAGNDYAFSIDTNALAGATKMFIKFYDEAKLQVFSTSVSFPISEWYTVVYNTTAPLNAKFVQVTICGNVISNGEAYVDNFKITKGNLETFMIPGKSVEYIPPKQVPAVDATLVRPIGSKLYYNSYNDNGDKLGDFSYAGFAEGKYNLPDTSKLPLAAELSPTGTGDDTKLIQDAIDKVASQSTDTSMKVIKLKTGKYFINKNSLWLKSGIVLSGEGQGPTGTILYAYEPVKYDVIKIQGSETVLDEHMVDILDTYLPVGEKTFTVSDTSTFKVGDLISITHPATDEWAAKVEMINMSTQAGQNNSWGGNNQNMVTERTITAINGNKITVDFAIFVPLIRDVSQSYVQKVYDTGRLENIGIENLRMESYYNGKTDDEEHSTTGIVIVNAKNVFARDITSKYFYGSLISSRVKAKQVTALNCSNIEPISKVSGSRRYTFATSTSAQQILYAGCYSSKGRHDYETSFEVTGPIVFLDSIADESYGGIETHGTWASGILYDNIYSISNSTQASIGIKNHGIYGTAESQGWTGVTSVIWNSLAPAIIVHRPPEPYQNFMVGSFGIYNDEKGLEQKQKNIDRYTTIYRTTSNNTAIKEIHFATKEGSPFVGDSYVENEFTPVNPRSLFKAQLAERVTGNIYNARANAPTIVNPKYDRYYKHNEVTIDGFCQLGANKVRIYIDNKPYEANIGNDCSFNVTVELEEGVHKIYATQEIDGIEGVKGPDRFIVVGKTNGNPSYLQSTYDISKTSFLTNDPRSTFDEIVNGIKVKINGNLLYSDVLPFETQGRVLVPMRAIFEALNAEVSWDETTFTATAVKDGITVKITENKTTTYVNDKPYELDVPATILNGRFVVPVRFISETFGAKVDWVDETKTVLIEN